MTPIGWNKEQISKLCEYAVDCINRTAPTTDEQTSFIMIRTSNVKNGRINLDDINYAEEEIYKNWTRRLIPRKGDVILTREAPVGEVGMVTGNENIFLGQRLFHFRTNEEVLDPNYLLYALLSPATQKYIQEMSFGATVKHLKVEEALKIPIAYPPLTEQIAIANLISTWDTAIEKIERLIAAKKKRFKHFSIKYLFGPGNGDKSSTKRTRWFTIPDHWQISRLGKIAKEVSTTNGPNSDIPVLSCTKYDGLVDSLAYFDKQIFSADTSKYKVVRKGQFAYATNHIEEGSIGYQDLYPAGLVSPMYTVFETNDLVDDSYLYKVLKTEVYRHIFQTNTSASVDRRGSLRWKEFAKLPVPLPPIEEQKEIATTLNIARREIDLLKKQLDAYRKQKRGLMQKLLTGRWRVKVGG